MANQYFYQHLVPLDDALLLLDGFELSDTERIELEELIYSIFHHRVMEEILISVPIDYHDELVQRLALAPDDIQIMTFIKEHDPEIEQKLHDSGALLLLEVKSIIDSERKRGN